MVARVQNLSWKIGDLLLLAGLRGLGYSGAKSRERIPLCLPDLAVDFLEPTESRDTATSRLERRCSYETLQTQASKSEAYVALHQ